MNVRSLKNGDWLRRPKPSDYAESTASRPTGAWTALPVTFFQQAPSVLSQKSIEEFTMWGPRRTADALVGRCFSCDGKAGPGRPPHRELCGELLTQDTREPLVLAESWVAL
jgi:hypothetical protein